MHMNRTTTAALTFSAWALAQSAHAARPTDSTTCVSDDAALTLKSADGKDEWRFSRTQGDKRQEIMLAQDGSLAIERSHVSAVAAPLGEEVDKYSSTKRWVEKIRLYRKDEGDLVVWERDALGNPKLATFEIRLTVLCKSVVWHAEPRYEIKRSTSKAVIQPPDEQPVPQVPAQKR